MRRFTILFAALFLVFQTTAQVGITTFGIQFKPLPPANLLTGTSETAAAGGVTYEVKSKLGYQFGGMVRHGLTKNISLEGGLGYVRRNFSAWAEADSTAERDSLTFGIIGYEIPITALVFVRLADKVYMNGAFGLSVDFFPAETSSFGLGGFEQQSFRFSGRMPASLSWLQAGLLTNVGFEYRTEAKGYFYLGATYHLPFRPIFETQLRWLDAGANNGVGVLLNGSYLSLDLRYFFHEPKQEKKD